jgi:acetyl esterase/lipase
MFFHRIPGVPKAIHAPLLEPFCLLYQSQKGASIYSSTHRKTERPEKEKPATDPSRRRYPVVVNFHGGGFTIGAAHDDSRWADAVVN